MEQLDAGEVPVESSLIPVYFILTTSLFSICRLITVSVHVAFYFLQEFMLTGMVQSYNAGDAQLEQVGLLEDMRVEWEQVQLLKAHLFERPSPLIGMDEVDET